MNTTARRTRRQQMTRQVFAELRFRIARLAAQKGRANGEDLDILIGRMRNSTARADLALRLARLRVAASS